MAQQSFLKPSATGKARFSRVELGMLLATAGAFLWAYQPVLEELVNLWGADEDYSHGFLIVPMVAYLLWRKRDLSVPAATGRVAAALSLGLVVVGTLGSLAGAFSSFRTLTYVSMLLTVWASLAFLFGWGWVKRNAWELFLLAFMLPIPGRFYAQITMPLQLLVSTTVTNVLHLAGIPVLREGNILTLPQTTLEVANACSGLRSIMASVVLAYVMACLLLPKTRQRLVLIAVGVPAAMLGNTVRVLIMVWASYLGYGSLLLEGAGHTLLGLAVFVVNLLLIVLVARGVRWCL